MAFVKNKQRPSLVIAGAKLSTPVPIEMLVSCVAVLVFFLAYVIPDTYCSPFDAMTI